ncbi:NUDIX hydrolase [Jatrophihabitans telluris]|uniref:NUDIX hydrolase n=1 Tax=Jatrophihabitans telluris TaxID=2038343 RepID=UPI00322192AA
MAGGVEATEGPEDTARRELQEELTLKHAVPVFRLDSVSSIPAYHFDRSSWALDMYVVPEFAFAADLTGQQVRLSDEHSALRWLPYEDAHELLTWDSNRTALWELDQRLRRGDI